MHRNREGWVWREIQRKGDIEKYRGWKIQIDRQGKGDSEDGRNREIQRKAVR